MNSTKSPKSRWKKFRENLNNFVLAMDHDPTQSSHHRIRRLEQELDNINTRLDYVTAKQTPPNR